MWTIFPSKFSYYQEALAYRFYYDKEDDGKFTNPYVLENYNIEDISLVDEHDCEDTGLPYSLSLHVKFYPTQMSSATITMSTKQGGNVDIILKNNDDILGIFDININVLQKMQPPFSQLILLKILFMFKL